MQSSCVLASVLESLLVSTVQSEAVTHSLCHYVRLSNQSKRSPILAEPFLISRNRRVSCSRFSFPFPLYLEVYFYFLQLLQYLLLTRSFSISQVLMRVEQEQRLTEDARRFSEQDAAAQRYAAQVLQVAYITVPLKLCLDMY